MIRIDWTTGVIGSEPSSVRTLDQMEGVFAASVGNRNDVVYEIFGTAGEVNGPPKLLYATTVLHPGQVEGEYFMTRGHFHTNPERGELVFTLSGEGALILMDRNRNTWMEPMLEGGIHDIDGAHAHRVANTGNVPLIFLVAWMSDCGHDYESIKAKGFSLRLFSERGLV
ncbi:MAG TPA: glucose-6-phosphate isomerase family protein [Fimbriimonadaceae bacterium]|nr:glucose-6-phosphate isomerase family protein [Fimbriimonadaceae bacterium]